MDREESREMLSSGHDVADAHLNSQQPWSPAQDQINQDFSVDRGGAAIVLLEIDGY